MRRAPPPSGSAPQMGLEALEVVKKKVSAPPRGPPPPGMTINFKGPRQVERPTTSNRGAKDYDDRYDDDRDRDYDRSFQDDDRADYDDRDRDRGDDNRDYRDRNNSQDRYYSDDDDDRDRYYNDDYDDHYRENQDRDLGDTRDTRDTRQFPNDHSDSHHHHSYSADADGKDYVPAQQAHHYQQQQQQTSSSSNNINNNQYVKQKAPPSPEAKAALSANNNNFNNNNNNFNNNNNSKTNNTVAPKKTVVFNFQPILKSTYRELRHFVLSPCQPGVLVRCYIERNRSGAKILAPFYSLCADLEDGTGRELVVCRKVWQSRTAHYVFSLKSEDLWLDRERRSRLYLGKLRAVGHGEYVLYDNGICAAPDADDSLLEEIEEAPSGVAVSSDVNNTNIARKMDRDRANEAKHSGSGAKHGEDVCLYRREMAVIKFNAMNRPAPQCVRGLEVCIPTVSPCVAEAKPTSNSNSNSNSSSSSGPSVTSNLVAQPAVFNLEKPFKKIRDLGRQNDLYRRTCLVLHERASRYDPLSACLVEFKGRAHMASIKNFQMVVSEPQAQFGLPSPGTHEQMLRADSDKEFVFMMAKTTEDCFNMDFKHPLSLFQAFAIAIARFDAKLSW